MTNADPMVVLGPALSGALENKGYTQLTSVQLAVLDPAIEGRDLRITSQTGSGKTVAIGFTLRGVLEPEGTGKPGIARPRALVVTPTRELAKQVEGELSWLFAGLGVKVASVIGGASYRDERRALGASPAVVVGTPGRLLDHLERGSIDPSTVAVVVLDEADRMLDLGFREELLAILGHAPESHLTHLASATFPRDVRALADRVQRNPLNLEGTRLGEANADIDHVIHLVAPDERIDAIVNLLCLAPDARTLVFARTRADVNRIATELADAGFAVSTLSGDMEQPERTRALTAFKRGKLRALVATDVAARGIDVQDVSEVIHVEAPNDADAYTHRSGRTGRAGRKGRSAILASLRELPQAARILKRAGVSFRFEPVPSADEIRGSVDDRIVATLTRDEPELVEGAEPEAVADDTRMANLARRLVEVGEVERTITRLLVRIGAAQQVEPREVRRIQVPTEAPRTVPGRVLRDARGRRRDVDRGPYVEPSFAQAVEATRALITEPPKKRAPEAALRDAMPKARPSRPRAASSDEAPIEKARPSRPRAASSDEAPIEKARPSRPRATEATRPTRDADRVPGAFVSSEGRSNRDSRDPEGGWVSFHVTWGELHGADARRLLALVCRRGGIRGADVGAIRVGRTSSVVEVASLVSGSFAEATKDRDPRDPRVQIREERFPGENAPTPTSHRPPPVSRHPAPPPSFRPPPMGAKPVRKKPGAAAAPPPPPPSKGKAGAKPPPKRMRAR